MSCPRVVGIPRYSSVALDSVYYECKKPMLGYGTGVYFDKNTSTKEGADILRGNNNK